ncbi:hypothetical protein BSKO_06748 [Bryopsis sp. KO-2023]|nr:hypothetical protein BSKO_06748 [Bryopsis sp. KO-2023]
MCKLRSAGSLLSAFLVVACLTTIGLPQSASAGGSGCEAVRAVVGVSARVSLDSAALKELDNDVETLANCMPAGAVLEFDLPELVLENSVELSSPITIKGNGASVQCPGDQGKGAFQIRSDDVTLSGLNFNGCFLNFTEGLIHVQNSKNFTLKHVDFEENKNVGGGPAGLSAAESEFTLLNVTAIDNNGSLGGVIAALDNSQATILNSNFTRNLALSNNGGAIYLQETNVTIRESTFEWNKAGGQGGALYAQFLDVEKNSEVYMIGCTFENNGPGKEEFRPGQQGGGLYLSGSNLKVSIKNSNFKLNKGFRGGAIYVKELSKLEIFNSSFVWNIALTREAKNGRGGGIFFSSVETRAVLDVSKSFFQSNHGDAGGAVAIQSRTVAKMNDVEFSQNFAHLAGGAIYALAENVDGFDALSMSLEMKRCLLESNRARFEGGGGIWLSQDEGAYLNATFKSMNFTENQGKEGGGILDYGGDLYVDDCSFKGNIAWDGGGALYATAGGENSSKKPSLIALRSSIFFENKATGVRHAVELETFDGKGGAVMMREGGVDSRIENCTFSKNEAGSGGALYGEDVRDLTVQDSYFSLGLALTGGALTVVGGASFGASFKNNVFSKNKARWGGAASFTYSGSKAPFPLIIVKQAHFLENLATDGGGAIDMEETRLLCTSCHFDSNSAGDERHAIGVGGAIRALSDCLLYLTDASITGCTATQSGGGVYIEGGIFSGTNLTTMNNTADKSGGGVAMHFEARASGQRWKCESCLFSGNKAATGGGIHFSSDNSVAEECQSLGATSPAKKNGSYFEFLAHCKNYDPLSDLSDQQVVLNKTSFQGNIGWKSGEFTIG